ncbi:hypothetical protein PROFUN_14226 [Planoprotostelium fungivorum]|uniref:Transmembrane protein n=1 Tax=Planoprotostelium fungivorum TaxID=1890364 RepID=A0A2P6N0S2_9EUKA|nr:hypothetical protein PROFUN_14226 [Planoprotostelium fungivorum]
MSGSPAHHSQPPFHPVNKHPYHDLICAISSVRGFRNGIITGARIRLPYVFQAVIYGILFRQGKVAERISFTVKQMFIHGKNLGLFVMIYKSLCCVFRNVGVSGGVDSWIAGFIGGYWAFGDNKGISGSVNNQIVLYLFARGLQGALISGVERGVIPKKMDVRTPGGFRILAGFSLALILYLTEYEPKTLSTAFWRTMDYLYYDSDSGPMMTSVEAKFIPFIIMGSVSLLYPLRESLGLEQMLAKILP